MIRDRSPRRAGFSLIELLVVIALIGVLAAITAAAVMRVRAAQQGKVTEQSLDKMQRALDQQWMAVIDRCRSDKNNGQIPPAVVALCQGDMDRAEALWVYINLKSDFPETFAEAMGDPCPNPAQVLPPPPAPQRGIWVWFPTNPKSPNSTPAVLVKPAKKTFNRVTASGTGNATGESAALLYLILNEKMAGGAGGGADDWTQNAQTDISLGAAGTFRVFRDSFGKEIPFVRFFQHDEIDLPPFVNLKDKAVSLDALDPRAKLYAETGNWTGPLTGGAANTFPYAYPVGAKQAALDALNRSGPAVAFNGNNPGPTVRKNKLITVISFGPNGQFENNPLGTTDDFYGYRIRKLGNRAD
ncbi:MAG: prepilin-type N-terminal cleavage/methylation domain-containing protein [Gemmataceae bacterium]|nr:prepilin-type N-terminal cleavage/methylation domain-containing protein [Gemmataceae bacterium]